MIFQFQQAIRSVILLSFTLLIFKLHYTGEITKFINPKYVGLSQTASVIFLVLFFIQITRIWAVKDTNHEHGHCHHDHDEHTCDHHHDHGDTPFNIKKLLSYSIIVFPLVTGFLLPPKVLDASIADKKGGMAILTNQKQAPNDGTSNLNTEDITEDDGTIAESEFDDTHSIDENIDPDLLNQTISKEEYERLKQQLLKSSTIEMNDKMFSTYYDEISLDLEKYKGKNIKLTGFVYKEDGFQPNQLVISRFLITHCVADASIIGFLSEFPEAASINEDTWIEAKGVLDITTYNGTKLPVIKITQFEKVSEPKEPYLYPVTVKIL